MTNEKIAEIAHEVNRAYCEARGDMSIAPWHLASEAQQKSVINGVEFRIANPNATPRESHDNWYAEKSTAGWKFAAVKCEADKTHPCMMAYGDLPEEHRVKDSIFLAVVGNLLEYWENQKKDCAGKQPDAPDQKRDSSNDVTNSSPAGQDAVPDPEK